MEFGPHGVPLLVGPSIFRNARPSNSIVSMARRNRPDPLARATTPRWLVTSTLCHEPLSCREIPPGADLHQVMRDALAASAADGWQPETDGEWGVFFARRGAERLQVSLQHVPPGTPIGWPSFLGPPLRA